jgi:hypothetical protein
VLLARIALRSARIEFPWFGGRTPRFGLSSTRSSKSGSASGIISLCSPSSQSMTFACSKSCSRLITVPVIPSSRDLTRSPTLSSSMFALLAILPPAGPRRQPRQFTALASG